MRRAITPPQLVPVVSSTRAARIPGFFYVPEGAASRKIFIPESEIELRIEKVTKIFGSSWSTWWQWPALEVVAEFCPDRRRATFPVLLLLVHNPAGGGFEKIVEHTVAAAFGVSPARKE